MPSVELNSSMTSSTFYSYLQKLGEGNITITPFLVPDPSSIKEIESGKNIEINTLWSKQGESITIDHATIKKCENQLQFYNIVENDLKGMNIYYMPLEIANDQQKSIVYVYMITNMMNELINRKDKRLLLYNNNVTNQNAFDLANKRYKILFQMLKSCQSQPNQSAGSKKPIYTRTNDPKVKTAKGMRCVYIGSRGAKYVKLGGVFVNIKKL